MHFKVREIWTCPHAPCAGLCEEPQTDLVSEAFLHKLEKQFLILNNLVWICLFEIIQLYTSAIAIRLV